MTEFTPGDFIQVQHERFHPDKVSEKFWRNALYKRKDGSYHVVVYATGDIEPIRVEHGRIRKAELS